MAEEDSLFHYCSRLLVNLEIALHQKSDEKFIEQIINAIILAKKNEAYSHHTNRALAIVCAHSHVPSIERLAGEADSSTIQQQLENYCRISKEKSDEKSLIKKITSTLISSAKSKLNLNSVMKSVFFFTPYFVSILNSEVIQLLIRNGAHSFDSVTSAHNMIYPFEIQYGLIQKPSFHWNHLIKMVSKIDIDLNILNKIDNLYFIIEHIKRRQKEIAQILIDLNVQTDLVNIIVRYFIMNEMN